MRIAFVNPPFYNNGRHGNRAGSRWPMTGTTPDYFYCPYPHFMGYATSYIMSKGHDVLFYDAIGWRHSYEKFYEELWKFKPDIIFQEIATSSFDIDMKVAEHLSAIGEVCLTGSHATTFSKELSELPYISYVIKGAYEKAAEKVINTRHKGIYDYEPIVNPDDLLYPYRADYMCNDKRTGFKERTNAYTMYFDPCCQSGIGEPMLFINASRGCPFKCEFCLWPHVMYEKQYRLRKVDSVIAEIEYCVSTWDYKYVYFDDDTWNIGGEGRMEYFCKELKKLNINWQANFRLDTCSKEMFKLMRECNCVGYRVGVESLSQKYLDRINKKEKVEDIVDKLNFIKSLGVDLYLLFMHGYPGETEEDRDTTRKFITEFGHRSQNPACIPFPGTPYYKKLEEKGLACTNWVEYDGCNLGSTLLTNIAQYLRESHE